MLNCNPISERGDWTFNGNYIVVSGLKDGDHFGRILMSKPLSQQSWEIPGRCRGLSCDTSNQSRLPNEKT